MRLLIELFLTFFKIGLFTFGGGYAMIPIIENACVTKNKWITDEEMLNMTVIAESTPGPIAINCSTYVGFKQKGFLGAVFATLGIIMPSFIIIFIISLFLDNFLKITFISSAFKGIKAAVGILIVDAALKMFKKMKKTSLSVILTASVLILLLAFDIFALNISSIVLLVAAAVVSLTVFLIGKAGKAGGKK
ncbi:MAG: chromate transporter [Clostridia bacterium]|nr:chromate transporter [Clostridia bacterium]